MGSMITDWRAATVTEQAAWLAGHIGGDGYRETEHGLEVLDRLRPGGFRAVCQKGHELETFTDRDAFEAHMAGHGKRKGAVGSTGRTMGQAMPLGSVALKPGQKPYPWTAPKPQKGGLEQVAAAIAAGAYDVSLYPAWVKATPERMGEVA